MKSVMKSKGSSDLFGDFLSNCVRDSVEAREYTQAEVDALKAKADTPDESSDGGGGVLPQILHSFPCTFRGRP